MSDPQTTPDKIPPCPFCGGATLYDNGFMPLEKTYYAYCSNIKCKLHDVEIGFTKEDWQTRTPSDDDIRNRALENEVVIAACRWYGADIYVHPYLSRAEAVQQAEQELEKAVQKYNASLQAVEQSKPMQTKDQPQTKE